MRKILSGRRSSGRGEFIMQIKTDISTVYGGFTPSASNQFYFPIVDGTDKLGYSIGFTIEWGDGQTSSVNSTNYATACLHTYSSPGSYTIKAVGNIAGFNFWGSRVNAGKADGNKLLDIQRWGDLKLTGGAATDVGQAFRECISLSLISANDGPWLPVRLNFPSLNSHGCRGLFSSCINLVTVNNIVNWDVSNCNSIEIMFSGCTKFQFGSAASGIIDLSKWEVGNIFRFERTFMGCSAMNAKMFTSVGGNSAAFPSNVQIDFQQMFKNCISFDSYSDGSMVNWDTTEASNMSEMFSNCNIFNENISSWDTGKVTTMRSMFTQCAVFNHPISSWDTSNVIDMRRMLEGTLAFDQPIGSWNVNAWNTVAVGDTPLTSGSAFSLSTANYDALLLAWDAAYTFPSWPGGTVDFGSSQYSLTSPGNAVATARTNLANIWGTLNDGGGI